MARTAKAEVPPQQRARDVALRMLAARPRTEAQVRARLTREQLAGEADAVVAWLRGLGYLDDAGYARARAAALLQPGKLGPLLAEKRLQQEGIAPGAARAAVRRALEGGEAADGPGRPAGAAEQDLCRTLAERRARGTPLATLDAKGRARLARFLAGRGFSGRVVAAVLGIYVDGEG
jgi:regulatory protein